MADCYYHGYSGGSGPCEYCRMERDRGLEPGEGDGSYVKDNQGISAERQEELRQAKFEKEIKGKKVESRG